MVAWNTFDSYSKAPSLGSTPGPQPYVQPQDILSIHMHPHLSSNHTSHLSFLTYVEHFRALLRLLSLPGKPLLPSPVGHTPHTSSASTSAQGRSHRCHRGTDAPKERSRRGWARATARAPQIPKPQALEPCLLKQRGQVNFTKSPPAK